MLLFIIWLQFIVMIINTAFCVSIKVYLHFVTLTAFYFCILAPYTSIYHYRTCYCAFLFVTIYCVVLYKKKDMNILSLKLTPRGLRPFMAQRQCSDQLRYCHTGRYQHRKCSAAPPVNRSKPHSQDGKSSAYKWSSHSYTYAAPPAFCQVQCQAF
jgi:hypothetical protein